MSRSPRIDAPDRITHITSRVNWRAWHLEDDAPKHCLARLIREAADAFGIELFAAVLMSNHMHVVAKSPAEQAFRQLTGRRTPCGHFRAWPRGHQKSTVIAQFMRWIRHRMSLRRQRDLGLSGRFWEGSYDARPVESATSLVLRIAYDHRNPVKAGIVDRPEQYRWSTARAWATGGSSELPVCIRGVERFGLSADELRAEVLRKQRDPDLDALDGKALERLAGLGVGVAMPVGEMLDRLSAAPLSARVP